MHNSDLHPSFTSIQIGAVNSALMVLKLHNREVTKENILKLHDQPAWASSNRWVAMVRSFFLNEGYQ